MSTRRQKRRATRKLRRWKAEHVRALLLRVVAAWRLDGVVPASVHPEADAAVYLAHADHRTR